MDEYTQDNVSVVDPPFQFVNPPQEIHASRDKSPKRAHSKEGFPPAVHQPSKVVQSLLVPSTGHQGDSNDQLSSDSKTLPS